MSEEEVIQMLRERLSIRVRESSKYTGGMDGGPLYSGCKIIQLVFDGKVISEDSL
jgi:hypothetical protein